MNDDIMRNAQMLALETLEHVKTQHAAVCIVSVDGEDVLQSAGFGSASRCTPIGGVALIAQMICVIDGMAGEVGELSGVPKERVLIDASAMAKRFLALGERRSQVFGHIHKDRDPADLPPDPEIG